MISPRIGTAAERKLLDKLCAKWIKIFSLEAPLWDNIIWGYKTHEELKGCYAYASWSPEYRECSLGFALPQVHEDAGFSLESTVIHEFLHIVLEGHQATASKYSGLYENGLNKLSAAFYTLAHAKKK